MKKVSVEEYGRYLEIVGKYGRKGCISNDYIQREAEALISDGRLYEFCGENNAFLFVRKDTCFRVYFYLNDLDETVLFDGDDLVVEILYRGGPFYPKEIEAYLKKCGFRTNLVRDLFELRFKNINPDLLGMNISDIDIRFAGSTDEAGMCAKLFNDCFDRYSGDYISDSMLAGLVEGRNLYVASEGGRFLGALHVSKGGNNFYWMDHLAVTADARGKHVGTKLFLKYIHDAHENDATRFQLWTQHDNEIAVRMYEKMGFKYIGKSTLSMIKTNR